MSPQLLGSVQLASCFFMAGVIWVIQLVHYPVFPYLDEGKRTEFATFHANRITWIVAPAMLGELASALALCLVAPALLWWLNLAGIAAIWLCTAALSVPCHSQLQTEYRASVAARLVRTNWPRTLLWSMRAAALLWYLN